MSELAALQARLDHLESRQAFQEVIIEELNKVIIQQQIELEKLRTQVRFAVTKLREVQASPVASQAEETPPPHY
ncbi:SlyX family protein [Plesiomonas shigelloides]|uniref:SlyX family protein n=1 Tax=Plesiomonas shigelloides TaxID=703 RepID=UPI002246EACA|nr:SlyX family protein [Plesiomonas shigelloides]MCX2498953.1 SlyX family protein [Plesiomonas shigelloides]